MNVNSVNLQELLQTYLISNVNSENVQAQGLMQGPPPGPPPGNMTDISQTGQILSQIRNELGDGENNEIRDFFKSVMDSVKNGTFDAAALAEDAPEALKTFMEEQGIDFEEFLNDFKDEASERTAAGSSRMQGMGPPPPIFSKISSEFGTGENDEIKNYFQNCLDYFNKLCGFKYDIASCSSCFIKSLYSDIVNRRLVNF